MPPPPPPFGAPAARLRRVFAAPLARLRRTFGAPLACLRHAFLLLSDGVRLLLTVAVVAAAVAADTVDDALAAHLAACGFGC